MPNPNTTNTESNTSTSTRRKNNSRDAGDLTGFRYFFRSSSRPPSPTSTAAIDSFDPSQNSSSNSSHARKTSFGSHRTPYPMSSSSTTLVGSSTTLVGSTNNASPLYFQGSSGSNYSGPSNVSTNVGSGSGSGRGSGIYHHQPALHPLSSESGRRRSIESYSRSPSPDQFQQQRRQGTHADKHVFPANPPSQNRIHSTTADPLKSTSEPVHRRTKSTDFGEMYSKRPGLGQEIADLQASIASPAKEPKKTLFSSMSLFKKKSHHPNSSSQTGYPSMEHGSRKYSADDPILSLATPSSTSLQSFATTSDQDTIAPSYTYERRHGSDGDPQRHLPPFSIGKKSSKRDILAQESILPGYV
ncbi:hypothetical protein BGZ65_011223, partial [Modicella reniformis]